MIDIDRSKLLQDKENEIKSLRKSLLTKELELDRIYRSRGWILLRFLYRIRKFLIPPESVRERFLRFACRTLKKLRRKCIDIISFLAAKTQERAVKSCKAQAPEKHDLFVFSIINWDFRFQRPQQIARKFAQAGHRVFYVSGEFIANKSVKVKEIEKNLFNLSLTGDPDINIYQAPLSEKALKQAADSLYQFCINHSCSTGILLVQLPFWESLAEEMRFRLGWPIVYDCMDNHAGFSTSGDIQLAQEQKLFEQADLVITSSSLLEKKARASCSNVALIRNAADYEHFASAAEKNNVGAARKTLIGYYGAISDWFDSDLAADLAELEHGWEFQLVGDTFGADLSRLKKLDNVKFLGETPYAKLPGILKTWDACIIPFRRVPLTESTNPVKVYEMLSAGMPVVSVDLPEMRPIAEAGLIRIAENAADFAQQLKRMISEQSPELVKERQAFAQRNTWTNRYNEMASAVVAAFPKVSIMIVMHNNLNLNKTCLSSILSKTDYPNYEIILVDNASTDGSREWALELSRSNNHVKVILNEENESFAKANNRAMDSCSGEYLVFLNNDTIVTCGWITRFLRHLKNDSSIGMIGPVSNAVGNEAKIDVSYTSPGGIDGFARQYCRRHYGETFEIPVLALFCAMIKRTLLESVGRLDECYDVGMFEDDDLCMCIKRAGFRLVCAEDVFIHHFQQGTFKLLTPDAYKRIFEANRKLYEDKWGAWRPHTHRKKRVNVLSNRKNSNQRSVY